MNDFPLTKIDPTASPEQRILAAAVQEFAEKGYFGARMQAMADAAGVNKAMLHYYFRTKDNLYRKVLEVAFHAIWENVDQILQDRVPMSKRLDRIVDLYMDLFSQNPGLVRILLREIAGGGERLRMSIQALKASGVSPRHSQLRIEAEMGLKRDELLHLIVSLIGLCLFSSFAQPFVGELFSLGPKRLVTFSRQRRSVIKTMLRVYLESLGVPADEEVS